MQTLPQDKDSCGSDTSHDQKRQLLVVAFLVCIPSWTRRFRFSNRAKIMSLYFDNCLAPAPTPRGHKPDLPKRQRTPFQQPRLMLVGGGQGASAFLIIIAFFWTGMNMLSLE